MRLLLLMFLIGFPFLIFSQEIEQDSIATNFVNPFIQDHSNQLNIKLDVTNEQTKYFIPYEGEKAEIKTNLNISYGVVFSYKFLSVRLGIRPKLSEEEQKNKGETDHFRLRVKLLFDKWTHQIEYDYTRGFYIENTNIFETQTQNEDFKIQLPYLTTNILAGSSQYAFNDNYSAKAIESNTEIQIKSAGTFIAGIDYALYFVRGTENIKLENQEITPREAYNEYTGFTPIFNAGYRYTFVFHKYWYANLYANPGLGVDFYKTTIYNNNESLNYNNTAYYFILKTGVSAGYNGEKIYFGGEYNYKVNSEKHDDNISLQPIKTNFHVFFGYRFKAPKQVRKPVEYIENKVPKLKDNN